LTNICSISNIKQEPGKFTTEANTVYNVNDPVVSDMDGEEKFKSFEKSEGESQSLIKQVTVLEPPAPDEETSSEFIEDDDEKSSELTEGEALLDPSKPFDDKIENSITKEETGDSGKLNEHDTIFHLPNSAFTACNLESTENVGGEYENLRESEAVDPSKTAVGKGYLDVSANIKEEVSIYFSLYIIWLLRRKSKKEDIKTQIITELFQCQIVEKNKLNFFYFFCYSGEMLKH
jgi:hypothetical protein